MLVLIPSPSLLHNGQGNATVEDKSRTEWRQGSSREIYVNPKVMNSYTLHLVILHLPLIPHQSRRWPEEYPVSLLGCIYSSVHPWTLLVSIFQSFCDPRILDLLIHLIVITLNKWWWCLLLLPLSLADPLVPPLYRVQSVIGPLYCCWWRCDTSKQWRASVTTITRLSRCDDQRHSSVLLLRMWSSAPPSTVPCWTPASIHSHCLHNLTDAAIGMRLERSSSRRRRISCALSTVPVSLFVPIALRISQIRTTLPGTHQSGSAAEEE